MDWEKLRNDTTFCDGAEPSLLVREVCAKLQGIPGWFTTDDCGHFALVLAMQRAMGLSGDLLEIGTYHGRCACLLARYLSGDERLVLCDLFERGERSYENLPTPADLWANLSFVNPGLSRSSVEIHDCSSQALDFGERIRFRFVHVDGGHSKEATLADLRFSVRHLLPGGVIAVDDYHHRDFPEVTDGVDHFLDEQRDCVVLSDLNRHGAVGRKLYLHKRLQSPRA